MRLAGLRLSNYKKFKQENFDLSKKVTLLYGENSSGKSSFLKAIAGAKQTFNQKNVYDSWAAQGDITDLGDYADFIHNHNTALKFGIGFTLFEKGRKKRPFEAVHYERLDLDLIYDQDKSVECARLYSIESKPIPLGRDTTHQKDYNYTLRRNINRSSFMFDCSVDYLDALNDCLNKRRFLGDGDARHAFSKSVSVTITGAKNFSLTKEPGNSITPSWISLTDFKYQFEKISIAFEKIFYLGPLRISPSRGYKKKLHEMSVGTNGEQTPAILYYMQQASEKSKNKSEDSWGRFSRWFSLVFNGCSVKTKKNGSNIEISILKDGRADSIQDIGFGYSQVIPIIAQAAVMEPGQTLIVEQPELHLHPKAQVELSRFLVDAIAHGLYLILETHSEHILKGMQLAISESNIGGELKLSKDDVSIYYFLNCDADLGQYKILELNEWGEIEGGWPKGFFDESLDISRKMFLNKNLKANS